MSVYSYPVALDVRSRRCVVVGGGTVGARKAVALGDAGARVVVVDPRIGVGNNAAQWICEAFAPAHLDGAFLAVAATDRPDVNQAVVRAARERGVLLNLAAPAQNGLDDTDGGDFVTMATVLRGDLLIGVTTGGAGPALAARLRRELEAAYGPEWGAFVQLLGEARQAARAIADPVRRAQVLRDLAGRDDVRELVASGDVVGAQQRVAECLS